MGSVVHADVGALLGLQKEDAAVHEIEVALAALGPKRVGLDKAKAQLAERLTRARAAVTAEETRQKELQERNYNIDEKRHELQKKCKNRIEEYQYGAHPKMVAHSGYFACIQE